MSLNELLSAGLTVSAPAIGGGYFSIESDDEVGQFVADQDGWYARAYGVSRDRIVAWKEFLAADDYQCRARTARGTRCAGWVGFHPVTTEVFDPEIHLFCRLHRRSAQAQNRLGS